MRTIEPGDPTGLGDPAQIWSHRELLLLLMWRNVRARYHDWRLGVAWAVFKPLATVAAFTLVLGQAPATAPAVASTRAPGTEAGAGAGYELRVLAGALPWFFFATCLGSVGSSLVANQHLLTKVSCPRLLLPLASLAEGVVDLALTLGVLAAIVGAGMLTGGLEGPGWGIVAAPAILILLAATGLGAGLLLATGTAMHRDVRQVLPFLIQVWMLLTPGLYLPGRDLGRAGWWLRLNPAQGLVGGFRSAILGEPLDPVGLAISGTIGLLILVAGLRAFRRVERRLPDLV